MNSSIRETATLLSIIFGGKRGGFVGLNGYVSSTTGEVANHICQTAVNFDKMKMADAKKMANIPNSLLVTVSKETKISFETVKEAANELAISALKNLNDETRTAQSQGQIDAYENFGNGIRVHKETGSIKIFALGHSKKVIVKGEYKKVNSRAKTIAKNTIKKALNLYESKYRNFTINDVNTIKINGSTINVIK